MEKEVLESAVDDILAESSSSTIQGDDGDLTTIKEVSDSQEGVSTGTDWRRGQYSVATPSETLTKGPQSTKPDKIPNFAKSANQSVNRSGQNSDR